MKAINRFSGTDKRFISRALLVSLLALLFIGSPARAAPLVTVSPSSGAIGTVVALSGTVFDSYQGDTLFILFDGLEIDDASPFIVPPDGTFDIVFTIPVTAAPGVHSIVIKNEVNSTSLIVESSFTVEPPALSIDVAEGPVGTSVTATGRGFYSDKLVTVSYDNPAQTQIGTRTTTATGRFTHTFLIPPGTAGAHRVSASTSAEGNQAESYFTVTPAIQLNVTTGGPGEIVDISGTGFAFRSDVTITFGTISVTTARTDDLGSFPLSFNIPETASGPFDIRAEDAEGNLAIVQFNVTAGANLSQASGAVGSDLTVRGNGFIIGSTITVDFATLRVATETADNNGGFRTTFSVPAVGSGTHIITVSDGTTVREFAYIIESDAPPAPALLLPSDNGQTKPNAYFDWQDVSDASLPLVYHLQVASDPGFSTIVLEKRNLTHSEYSLAASENLTVGLQPTFYYWRVKAEDAAWNESEWSVPWSFFISPPPVPTLIVEPANIEIPEIEAATGNGTTKLYEEGDTVFIEWGEVASISQPVTYAVELAADPDFTEPVLERAQLTGARYIFTEEDLLALQNNTPYYWRVKATDADNVESGWSETGSFTIGTAFKWPIWATVLLAGIGVIIVGFFAFRLGRRTAFNQMD